MNPDDLIYVAVIGALLALAATEWYYGFIRPHRRRARSGRRVQ